MKPARSSSSSSQQGRTAPIGGGHISKRTKGDGQEMPALNEEFADKRQQPLQQRSPWQYASATSPAKPSRRGSAPIMGLSGSSGFVVQSTSVDGGGGVGVDVDGGHRHPSATTTTNGQHGPERGVNQIPAHASPGSHVSHGNSRRRVNSLSIRSLNTPPSDIRSPSYDKGIDTAGMPRSAGYLPYQQAPYGGIDPMMNGVVGVGHHQVHPDALLQNIQMSTPRRKRQQYAPSFASRTSVEGSPSSNASSRTSSMSDLSTSFPADLNVYPGSQRHFPAHPASGYQTQSQPSSGYHTPINGVHPSNGHMSPPTYHRHAPSPQHAGLSPNRPRSDRVHQQQQPTPQHNQQQQRDHHIAPANIHSAHSPYTRTEDVYAATTALLRSATPGSHAGVTVNDGSVNGPTQGRSPGTPHKDRHMNRENLARQNSNGSDSPSNGVRHMERGSSSDSIDRALDRLIERESGQVFSAVGSDRGTTATESAISPMSRAVSNGSIESSGSSGIGHSNSPSLERGVRISSNSNIMTTIAESRTIISRSSSGSSLSASSCTSLDASNSSTKRVVFGASSDRKKVNMNKEPPSIQEAKQAAMRTLTAGQAMEAAASGNLAQLHRVHATAVQAGEQLVIVRDANGATPLHKAAENGHIEIVNFLLDDCGLSEEGRKKATAMADKDYITACMLAVQNGHLDCVKVLVEASQGDFETDDHGSTLLHLAAAFDQVDCLEYIVEAMKQHGIDAHVATDTGVTPAHVAAQKGSINCLRVLFDAGTQIQPDDEDLTPIDWARKAGHGLCEHYLTVIQTCWALHAGLEDSETKLARTTQKNRALETQLAEAQKQQSSLESEIQKVKDDCEKRLKETKEDFAQLMTRMMEQVGGGRSVLEEKVKLMNVGTLFPSTSPTSTLSGKKPKTASPPVPPRTVTLTNSADSSPASGRSEKKRSKATAGSNVQKQLKLHSSAMGACENGGDLDEVMSVVEREQQLDSLNMSNMGISDVEEDVDDDDV